MSSTNKDARWGLALHWLGNIGLSIEDVTSSAMEKILAEAERKLSKNPSEIPYWAERFNADKD